MRSEGVWGDPDRFRPERFLTSDGKGLNGLEKYIGILFGHGKVTRIAYQLSYVLSTALRIFCGIIFRTEALHGGNPGTDHSLDVLYDDSPEFHV